MKILVNEFGEAIQVESFSEYDIEQSKLGIVTLINTFDELYHNDDGTKDGDWVPISKRDH